MYYYEAFIAPVNFPNVTINGLLVGFDESSKSSIFGIPLNDVLRVLKIQPFYGFYDQLSSLLKAHHGDSYTIPQCRVSQNPDDLFLDYILLEDLLLVMCEMGLNPNSRAVEFTTFLIEIGLRYRFNEAFKSNNF